MQRFIGLVSWAVLILVLSGCQTSTGTLSYEGKTPILNKMVSIQKLASNLGSDTGNRHKIRVSSINVTAPRKGQLLAETYGSQSTTYLGSRTTRNYGAKYWLENNMELPVREAVSELFKLDSSSSRTVNIVADLSFSLHYAGGFCYKWDTETRTFLDVKILSNGAKIRQKKYQSKSKETICGSQFGIWLQEDEAKRVIHGTLQDVIGKMVKDLGVGKMVQPDPAS